MYFTGSAGSDYDSAPYDSTPDERADIRRVVALAALYGGNVRPVDVLDLGSGFGRVLEQVAPFTTGRLVGVDASRVACEGARARLAAYGDRSAIIAAEFQNAGLEDLGQFDLILCLGTLYALPQEEQAALLEMMGRLLRPGGAIVISYYAGLIGHFRYEALRLVRESVRPGSSHEDALNQGRTWLRQFQDVLEQSDPMLPLWREALTVGEATFSHEVLGHGAAPLRHSDLNRSLMVHGAGFASILPTDLYGQLPTPELRAVKADVEDIGGGSHRYGLFVRPQGEAHVFTTDVAGVVWLSNASPIPDQPGRYRNTGGVEYDIGSPHIHSLLETIGSGPLEWREIMQAMTEREGHADASSLTAEVAGLWRMELIYPCPAHMLDLSR